MSVKSDTSHPWQKSDHRVLWARIIWQLVKRTGRIEMEIYMTADVATIIKYSMTLNWATKLTISPEMVRALINENIQEIYARFVPIKVLNSSFRAKWFTRTISHALPRRNELYWTIHAFIPTHATAVSLWSGIGLTCSGTGVKPRPSRKLVLTRSTTKIHSMPTSSRKPMTTMNLYWCALIREISRPLFFIQQRICNVLNKIISPREPYPYLTPAKSHHCYEKP